jgi:XTP/dITP diphosphohydrolase
MSITLYVATSNPGKLRDFAVAAQSAHIEIVPLPGIENISPPPEDATTFTDNARNKAIAYSQHAPGCIVLSDDSGLEVDALHGAPCVRSARFAEDAGFIPDTPRQITTDECNNLFLLRKLHGIPAAQRTARYRCTLAAAKDGECIAIADGTVEGIILESPQGNGGFGYDPLFYLPDLHRTMAEISLDEKIQLSHRGLALRALLGKLRCV